MSILAIIIRIKPIIRIVDADNSEYTINKINGKVQIPR